jgi:hypothetical protein
MHIHAEHDGGEEWFPLSSRKLRRAGAAFANEVLLSPVRILSPHTTIYAANEVMLSTVRVLSA